MKLPAKYINKVYGKTMEAETSMIMNPNKWVTMIDNEKKIYKKNYALTIHQRQYDSPNLQNFRFLQGKLKIPSVYEIDDYLHGVHPESSAHYAYNKNIHKDRFANIETYMKEAAALTVTTDYLKKLYGDYNKHIYVLPNYLDFEDIYIDQIRKDREEHRLKHEANGEIWIGWAGSNTHLPDLKMAADAIVRIVNEYPNVRLALGGWDGFFRDKKGVIHRPESNPWKDIPDNKKVVIPWAKNMQDYAKMLSQFDIGIAPLEDNDFNRAKSDIKFREYSAAGTPCIASDVEPYSKAIKHGENGLLVKTKGAVFIDWYKKLKRMVEDREFRLKTAEITTKKAIAEYNMEKNIQLWKDVYLEIIKRGV